MEGSAKKPERTYINLDDPEGKGLTPEEIRAAARADYDKEVNAEEEAYQHFIDRRVATSGLASARRRAEAYKGKRQEVLDEINSEIEYYEELMKNSKGAKPGKAQGKGSRRVIARFS